MIDKNCQIVVVSGNDYGNKCYALGVLHQHFHQLESEMKKLKDEKKFELSKAKYSEMKSLCGEVNTDKIKINGQEKERKVIPSPIWIRDLGNYQVVIVFGATQNPRRKYLQELKNKAYQFVQIFPFQ